jgi:anti-anti-sigma regulatory factor
MVRAVQSWIAAGCASIGSSDNRRCMSFLRSFHASTSRATQGRGIVVVAGWMQREDREKQAMWLPARLDARDDDSGKGVVLAPDADMTSSDRVRDLFNGCRRLLRRGVTHVVIDLQAVTAADTKLLACLVALLRLARSASAHLEICLSSAVLDVARVCRMEWLAEKSAK